MTAAVEDIRRRARMALVIRAPVSVERARKPARVRTPAGVRRYDQPIGTLIVANVLDNLRSWIRGGQRGPDPLADIQSQADVDQLAREMGLPSGESADSVKAAAVRRIASDMPGRKAAKAPAKKSRRAGITPQEFEARHDEGTRAGLSDAEAARYARSDYDSPRAWREAHPAKAAKKAPAKKATPSAEDRQRRAEGFARRYERGESISQIAAAEGVSYSTVHSALTKGAGIQLRPRGGAKKTAPAKKAAPRKASSLRDAIQEQQERDAVREREQREARTRAAAEALSQSHTREALEERRRPAKTAPAKATPRKAAKKTTPAAETGAAASGLSTDPEVRAVQVRNSIVEVYRQLTPGGRENPWASIADIRDRLSPELSRDEVDQALRKLNREPGVTFVSEPQPSTLTGRERDAAARFGGQDHHYLSIDGPRVQPVPGGQPATAALRERTSTEVPAGSRPTGEAPRTPEYGREVEDAVRDAYQGILSTKGREPGGWVGLAELREALGDRYSRVDVDNAIARLQRQRGVVLVQETDQTVLTREQRRGAIILGGQANHLIAFRPGAGPRNATRPAAGRESSSVTDLSDYRRGLDQGLSPRDASAFAAWARNNPGGTIAQWRAQRERPPGTPSVESLRALTSREDAREAIGNLNRTQLVALATELRIPGARSMNIAELRAQIVQDVVGRRLDSRAIRGFDEDRP